MLLEPPLIMGNLKCFEYDIFLGVCMILVVAVSDDESQNLGMIQKLQLRKLEILSRSEIESDSIGY